MPDAVVRGRVSVYEGLLISLAARRVLSATGDNNALDNQAQYLLSGIPTPRVYARFPFYNLMNSKDQFVQLVDKPTKRIALRSDLHWLQLTSGNDLWYQGGGAFDNKVFGYVGTPSQRSLQLCSLADVSADWQATHALMSTLLCACLGKIVAAAIYPTIATRSTDTSR